MIPSAQPSAPDPAFLASYLGAFDLMEGMFSPDAALMFMAYNQLVAAAGISGNVLEIGVHHGLSAIAIASMRGQGGSMVAIDLFDEQQSLNSSKSGSGSKARFLQNMQRFYNDVSFVRIITRLSSDVTAADLGAGYSFCHVDGGHSADETYGDLRLCHEITRPGGLIALDDYFNPSFPGVCEGGVRFATLHPGALIPLAIGFNKVLFQKAPAPFELNARFAQAFPEIGRSVVTMWESPVFLFGSGFRPFIDIAQSTPAALRQNAQFKVRARIEPQSPSVMAKPSSTIQMPVAVTNESSIPFTWGSTSFGLSYHLLDGSGAVVQFDNRRVVFREPLNPGEQRLVQLPVAAPEKPGRYILELDVVWEGVAWLKDKGSRAPRVNFDVR